MDLCMSVCVCIYACVRMKEGLPTAPPSVERGREEHLTLKALASVGFEAKEDDSAWLLTAQSIDMAAILSLSLLVAERNKPL